MAALLGLALIAQVATGEPIEDVAAEAGVEVTALADALHSVRQVWPYVTARQYLVQAGELTPPRPPLNAAVERRLDCIERYESHGFAGAYNRTSGASGAFQFLGSTWRQTPQGQAGLSPFDYVAAREAARWMARQGRWREWEPVARGWC